MQEGDAPDVSLDSLVGDHRRFKAAVKKAYPLPDNTELTKENVLIIATGGTFAQRKEGPDDQYQVVPGGELLAHLLTLPQFRDVLEPEAQQTGAGLAFLELDDEHRIDSTDADYNSWNLIATIIWQRAKQSCYRGYVVIHGTDTLAYTASALAFMVYGTLQPPIVVMGSQNSIFDLHSDALNNLLGACYLAGDKNTKPLPEVVVYFHNKVLLGTRVTKVHSVNYDAFHTPNIGVLGYYNGKWHENDVQKDDVIFRLNAKYGKKKKPKTHLFLQLAHPSVRVAVFQLFPGFALAMGFPRYEKRYDELTEEEKQDLTNHIKSKWGHLHGIVLQAYGAGNAPWSVRNLLRLAWESRNIVPILCTECFQGTAGSEYGVAVKPLAEGGEAVILNDVTAQAAYTKLVILLSRSIYKKNRLDASEVAAFISQPLRGEFTAENAMVLRSANVSLYRS